MVFISFHLIPQNCIWSRLWCRFSANLPGLTNLNTMSKLVKWPRGILLGPKGKLWSSKSDLEKLAISLIISFTEYGCVILYYLNHIPHWYCLMPRMINFCKKYGIIYLVYLPKHAEHLGFLKKQTYQASIVRKCIAVFFKFPWLGYLLFFSLFEFL